MTFHKTTSISFAVAALLAALAPSRAAFAAPIDSIAYSPGMGTWGTLLFEDSWPSNGDLDFNDQVVAWREEIGFDASGNVIALDATFNVLAAGASFHNGVYFHLPGIAPSAASSVTIVDSLGNSSVATQMPDSDLVVEIVNDTRSTTLFPLPQFPFINTSTSFPVETPARSYRVQILFTPGLAPAALNAAGAPFDVFLARSNNYGWQIHLPQYNGTSSAQAFLSTKFQTANDCSNAQCGPVSNSGRFFVNHKGLPFALSIPTLIRWPQEQIDISKVYPDITTFGTSGGTQDTSWYNSSSNGPIDTAKQFTAGFAGGLAPAPVFVMAVDIFTPAPWIQVAAGILHLLALKADGTLWAWGVGVRGDLGLGPAVGVALTPAYVGANYKSIAAGGNFSLGIKNDGRLWAWGDNSSGQVGINSSMASFDLPKQVGSDTDWTAVSGGYAHSMALKSNGEIWAWGGNIAGQLGNNSTATALSPQRVGTGTYLNISAGQSSSAAIGTDGSLWTWGSNLYGQLCENTDTGSLIPKQIGALKNYLSVSVGYGFALVASSDQSLQSCGINNQGQLGDGTSIDVKGLAAVSASGFSPIEQAGSATSYAVKSDGSLWVWGQNSGSLFGNGSTASSPVPTQVTIPNDVVSVATTEFNVAAVTADGGLWTWGTLFSNVPLPTRIP